MWSYYFTDNHPLIEHGILKKIDNNYIVVIPEGVRVLMGQKEKEDIGKPEFGCDIFYDSLARKNRIKQVILPEEGIEVIGEKAFEHDHLLFQINFPEGLREIRLSSFLGCSHLHRIELPKSIAVLDQWCFALISNLIIQYHGTLKEWQQIKKGSQWCDKGTIIYTTDSKIII